MELRHIRSFLVLAEELSFTRAAAALHITQPALTQQIRRLEDEIGSTLFQRTTRAVHLTAVGEALLPHALQLAAVADATLAAARAAAEADAGSLTVGVFFGGAAELTAPIVQAFRAAHPAASLTFRDVLPPEQEHVLTRGAVDVLLARPPLDEEHIVLTPLFEEPRVLLVAQNHPLAAEAAEVTIETVLRIPTVNASRALPPRWYDYWSFGPERNGESLCVTGDPVSNVTEAVLLTSAGITAMPAAASTARITPSAALCAIPFADASWCSMAIATRRNERRPLVHAFCANAVTVAKRLIHLVPFARPPQQTGACTGISAQLLGRALAGAGDRRPAGTENHVTYP